MTEVKRILPDIKLPNDDEEIKSGPQVTTDD